MLKTIFTEEKLTEIGFKPTYLPTTDSGDRVLDEYDYEKGKVCVSVSSGDLDIYVYGTHTKHRYEGQFCLGVKTEQDLLDLCRLVNGSN